MKRWRSFRVTYSKYSKFWSLFPSFGLYYKAIDRYSLVYVSISKFWSLFAILNIRYAEALEILKDAARVNGNTLPADDEVQCVRLKIQQETGKKFWPVFTFIIPEGNFWQEFGTDIFSAIRKELETLYCWPEFPVLLLEFLLGIPIGILTENPKGAHANLPRYEKLNLKYNCCLIRSESHSSCRKNRRNSNMLEVWKFYLPEFWAYTFSLYS